MAYVYHLGTGQNLYVENQDAQTMLTLASSGSGQQQSQRSGYQTGTWLLPPVLFRVGGGLVLRVETDQGQFFFQVQSSGMQVLQSAPALGGAEVIEGQQVSAESIPGMKMQPMKPMEPMKMGDMQMQNDPMQMQMGDMQMQMGSRSSAGGSGTQPKSQTGHGRKFCSQCGSRVAPEDRFCSSCGHELSSAG